MAGLQLYDIFVLILLGIMTFWGGMRGIFSQLASIAALVVAWLGASNYYGVISSLIPLDDPWRDTVAMLALFFILLLAIRFAVRMVRGVVHQTVLKEFDRQLGALLGLLKGGVICLLVTFFAVTGGDSTRNLVVGSPSGRFMVRVISSIQQYVPKNESHEKIQKALAEFSAAAQKEGAEVEPISLADEVDSVKTKFGDWFNEQKTATAKKTESAAAEAIEQAGSNKITEWANGLTSVFSGSQNAGDTVSSKSNQPTSGVAAAASAVFSSPAFLSGITSENSAAASDAVSPYQTAAAPNVQQTGTSILERPTFTPQSTAPPF